MAEQVVELAPNESKAVSFEAVPSVAKTYYVSVNGLTGSFVAIEVLEPITIDSFRCRIARREPSSYEGFVNLFFGVEIAITNHTGETIVGQGARHGDLRNTLVVNGYNAEGRGLGDWYRPRPSDRYYIGDVSPGTHTYRGTSDSQSFRIGEEPLEGDLGYAVVHFEHEDVGPSPNVTLIDVEQTFEGEFSSAWQTWEKSSWKPPEEFPYF